MPVIDEILPSFDHREYHEVEVEAGVEVAVAAFLAAPAAPDRVVRSLLRLRGVRAGATIEDLLATLGFGLLHRTASEVVVGGAGRPWTPHGGIRAFADARPGEVRVAVDVRARPLTAGRSVLSTETRIEALDSSARRAFGRYWRVIGPFSGLIRQRWLRHAAAFVRTRAGEPHRL